MNDEQISHLKYHAQKFKNHDKIRIKASAEGNSDRATTLTQYQLHDAWAIVNLIAMFEGEEKT